MGKGNKKKFIEKGEGQHFYLLHRSQTDTAHLGEAPPSNFVLVKAEDRVENRVSGHQPKPVKTELRATKDHINELGFKNDGYDYSQHLKEMGGGHFIGVNGKVQEQLATSRAVELPEDALPSGEEFSRQLEAITIGDEFMDDDIREALFGEGVEEGEFEELDDDFISQAMTAPETVDFDFDAHIAALIARSEGQLEENGQRPRGWSDDDDDEGSDVSSYDEEKDYAGVVDSSCPKEKAEHLRSLEEQFEKTLEEYNDEDIGDLEDEALDDEMQGEIELDGDDDLFTSALDEFLQESKDNALAEGITTPTTYVKNSHAIGSAPGQIYEGPMASTSDPEIVKRMQEFTIESLAEVEPEDESDAADIEEVMKGQAYLAEERQEDQWDCETILSTYSTLDNHPALIQSEKKSKKKKGRRRLENGEIDDSASSVASSSYSTSTGASLSNGRGGAGDVFFSKGALRSNPTTQITLGGKYMLPKKNGMSAASASALSTMGLQALSGQSSSSKGAASNKQKSKTKQQKLVEEEEEEDDDDSSGSSVGDGEEGEEGEILKREKKKTLRQRETPEEKKLRKAQVKEERRQKRATKKQLKNAFRSEETRQGEVTGQKQDTDGVSVFRY